MTRVASIRNGVLPSLRRTNVIKIINNMRVRQTNLTHISNRCQLPQMAN